MATSAVSEACVLPAQWVGPCDVRDEEAQEQVVDAIIEHYVSPPNHPYPHCRLTVIRAADRSGSTWW